VEFLGGIVEAQEASNSTLEVSDGTCTSLVGCSEDYFSQFNQSYHPRALSDDLKASILSLGDSYCSAHELYKEIPGLETDVALRSQEAVTLFSLGCPCNIETVFPKGSYAGDFLVNITVSGFQGAGIQGLRCAFGDVSVPAVGHDGYVSCSSVPEQLEDVSQVDMSIQGPSFTLKKSSGNQQVFYYFARPVITSFKPRAVFAEIGLEAGRRSITITGSGFSNAYGGMSVRFGCESNAPVVEAAIELLSCDASELNCTKATAVCPEQDSSVKGPNGDGTYSVHISINGAYYEPSCPGEFVILRFGKPSITAMSPTTGSPTGLRRGDGGELEQIAVTLSLFGLPSLQFGEPDLYCVFSQFSVLATAPSEGTLVCDLAQHTVLWDSTWLVGGTIDVYVTQPDGTVYTNNTKRFEYAFEEEDVAAGVACPERTFGNGVLCVPCPPNTFMPKIGYPTCFPCPNHSTSLGNSTSCSCTGGGYEGTIEDEGDECTPCTAGNASVEGTSVCSQCPIATYAGDASPECIQCPLGAMSLAGSTSVDACQCGASQYLKDRTCCNFGNFLDPTNNECTPCPRGTYENASHCLVRT